MIDDALEFIAGTDSAVVIGVFKALLTTVALPLLLFLLKSWHAERLKRKNRRRDMYADALAACMEYREFPYVIYRRNAKQSADERTRISEALRDVQKRISYYQAWLNTESKDVATAYNQLVKTMREVAGNEMKKRWSAPPIKKDSDMTVAPKFDWSSIDKKERAYIEAVNKVLK